MDLENCKIIKDFCSWLVNIFEKSRIKGVIPIIFMFILGLTFISPSYIFINFYKIEIFLAFNLTFENMLSIIILDVLLFWVLFAIGLFRDIELDKDNNFINNGKLSKDVVMTIVLMGVVSICLVTVYGIFRIKGIGVSIKIGIRTLYITILSIAIFYFQSIGRKVLKAIWRQMNGINILIRIFIIMVCWVIFFMIIAIIVGIIIWIVI